MLYLIDGYNLLHAIGVAPGREGPKALHFARLRLLTMLRGAFADDSSHVTVVFDAAGAPTGSTEVHDYKGIEVRFAVHHEEADDLIELLIQKAPVPRRLTVVSNDHRIQQAARRRQCIVLGCDAFLDWLERRRPPQRPTRRASAKPEKLSAEESAHWQREFADLDNDPAMKELFDPFGFESDDAS